MKPCDCQAERRKQALVNKWVPDMWKGLKLEELTPTSMFGDEFPIRYQASIIEVLEGSPLGAHSFFGPSGMGKSRFLYCLLQEAINHGCKHIFFSKMAPLVRALRDNEFKQLPEERWNEIITPDDLKECHSDPMHIFIDEFDKVPFTDDIYLRIFELIDFIYENQKNARLCICSNLSLENFTAVWGEGLLRRIGAISHIHKLWGDKW
jgi:DNA replication protein DnaC